MDPATAVLRIVVVSAVSAAIGSAQERPSEPVRVEEKDPRRQVRLHGSAVALDHDGNAHAKEEGSFQLYHKVDGLIDVAVHHGEWEAWTSVAAPCMAGHLELGGRSVKLERTPFRPPFESAIDLRGPWIEDLVLHVVDETSDAELDHLEIVKELRDGGYASHPGFHREDQVVAKDEHSPLHLSRFGSWFIRAPGHAWQEFNFLDRAEQRDRLELPAACALVIDAKGLDPKGTAKLRIEPGNGTVELLTLDPSHGPHIELDALPPGRFHVRAFLDFHMKPWFWHTVTLGEAIVTLAPDAAAHAAFVVGPPPAGLHEDGTVDRDGIVSMPDGTARKPFTGDGTFTYRFVKLHDADLGGLRGRGWSGVFEQTADGYDMQREYTATITGGKFKLRPPYGTHVQVTGLTLDGRSIELDSEHRQFDTVPDPIEIAVPSAGGGQLLANWTTLHVVSAETKGELSHVEVVSGIGWPQSELSHPGRVEPGQILLQDGVSPLPLPTPAFHLDSRVIIFSDERSNTFWVRADGYAWTRFQQNPTAGGERYVALERACDLEVRLEPNVVEKGAVLRVRVKGNATVEPVEPVEPVDRATLEDRLAALGYVEGGEDEDATSEPMPTDPEEDEGESRAVEEEEAPPESDVTPGGKPMLEIAPDPSGKTVIEGLPRGPISVSLELGDWFEQPERFGAAKADGSKGGRIALTLAVRPPAPKPDPVPLSGTLFIPVEWGKVDAHLNVKPESGPHRNFEDWIKISLRSMRHDEAEPGIYRWSAGNVLPGKYSLALGEFGFERTIKVGSAGDVNERIDVAPPADVTIHLVEASTGMPAPVDSISWFLAHGSLNSDKTVQASRNEPSSEFHFRAPIGRLMVFVWRQPFDLHQERVLVQAGSNEFTVKLVRECGVRIHLRSGGIEVPWDEEAFHISFRRLDGKGGNFGWGTEGGVRRFTLKREGRYRVSFGRFPGFKPVPPREVVVGPGEIVDLTIELEVDL